MIGQLLDGRYRIVEILGSGAFGQTYLAEDSRRPGNPKCVVKQLSPITNGSISLQAALRLFKREAEILERLGKHDKIPQLLAYFTEDQRFYLVKEYTPGHPLTQEIVPSQPLSEEQVTAMLSEVLEILVFVHGNQVIHRDIKPANLIRRAADDKLVLIDFGSVKEISAAITQGQAPWTIAAGTPAYMPVEQFQGNPQFNSDIYALGTIAIQALTGLPAADLPKLQDPNTGKINWRHRVHVTPALGTIIDKMVHHHYGQRYQTAGEVLTALNKLRPPVEVTPPPGTIAAQIATQNDRPSLRRSGRQRSIALISLGVLALVGLIFLLQRPNPLKSQKFYNRGQEKARSGDQQGAIEDFNQAIRLNPKDREAYFKRANVRYGLGDLETAIADYTRAIELDPTYAKAYFNRGLARSELGDRSGAIEDFNQTIKLSPNDADAYYQRGLTYFDFKDYRTAIEDYNQAIRLAPKDAKAYYARGLARSFADDKQGALEDYTAAIGRDPENSEAYYSRGLARYFLADYQGAMEDYSQAIRLNPQYGDAYGNRCAAYLNLGEHQKAVEDCTQALAIDAKQSTAYENRCIAYMNLNQLKAAIDDCTQAIQLAPNNPKLYANRGLVRSAAEDWQGSIEDYSEAIRLNPSDAVAYSNRATAHAERGNYGSAIADYAQAIRVNPNFAGAYFKRGLVRAQMGDKPGAIDDLQKASSLYLEQGRPSAYKDVQHELSKLRQ